MPRATADTEKSERFDLKTCPEGFVVVKRMTYGQKLQRMQLGFDSSVTATGGKAHLDLSMTILRSAEFDFRTCIVDHNLEDEQGNKLDFTRAGTIEVLDPRIGEEISSYISTLNNFDEEVAQGNS